MNDMPLPSKIRRPTMIKGLIPSLPERGKIKIGRKGAVKTSQRGTEFQPPQKLDHFVVTTLQRGADGNFIPDDALMARLGDKPVEIPVRLLYDDPTLNFPTRYACFVGRSLWCSGDGEVAIRAPSKPNEPPQEVACTCERADPAYKGNDKCKMNGSLSVLIEGAGGIGGVWKFRTTSYNSIVGIMSTMAFIRSMTGGVLANIPLKLKVQPKQATAPDGSQVTIYIVSLEFDGDMNGLQTLAHGIALGRAKMNISIEHIEEEARRLLALAPPANVPLPGDDTDDVIEEFYPEQVATPANTRADLDKFAGATVRNADVIDAETGEVLDGARDEPTVQERAREAAKNGDAALREFWFSLSPGERKIIGPMIGTESHPGELRVIAQEADRARDEPPATDVFGLPPSDGAGLAPPAEGDRLLQLRTGEQQQVTAKYTALPRDPTDRDFQAFADWVDATLDDGVSGAVIRADNKYVLDKIKERDWERYEQVSEKLAGGR